MTKQVLFEMTPNKIVIILGFLVGAFVVISAYLWWFLQPDGLLWIAKNDCKKMDWVSTGQETPVNEFTDQLYKVAQSSNQKIGIVGVEPAMAAIKCYGLRLNTPNDIYNKKLRWLVYFDSHDKVKMMTWYGIFPVIKEFSIQK